MGSPMKASVSMPCIASDECIDARRHVLGRGISNGNKAVGTIRKSKLDHPVHFSVAGIDLSPHLLAEPEPPSLSEEEEEESKESLKESLKESQAPSGASDGSGGKAVDAFYEVVACVNHTGTLSKGHYTAHVKEGGLWFNADDMYIEHLSEDDVQANADSGEPYIIFLQRRESQQAAEEAANGSGNSGNGAAQGGKGSRRSVGVQRRQGGQAAAAVAMETG